LQTFLVLDFRDFELALELADPGLSLSLHSDVNILHRNEILHLIALLVIMLFLGGAEVAARGFTVASAYYVAWRRQILPELGLVGVEFLHTLDFFKHGRDEAAHVT
jgi:hypothetical protein